MNPAAPIIQELESRVAERTRELSEVLDLNRKIIRESVSGILAFRAASGECVLANEAAAAIIGAEPASLLLVNFRQLQSWRDAGLYQRAEEVLASGVPSRREVRFLTSFGKEVWLDSVLTGFTSSGEPHLLLMLDDICERKQAEVTVHRAMEAAEAANHAKNKFLANMSHEIRTPMNAILGLGQLALQTDLSDQQRGYLLRIQGASKSLLGMLNDILDFSNMEAGKLALEPRRFSLHDSLSRIAGLLAERLEQKGLEIVRRIEPEVPDALVGDPIRLEQVLMNLLDNAVKFTESGQVALTVDRGAAAQPAGSVTLRFSVTDSGIGLSSGDLDQLFQPFTQSDSSTTRRYGGTGLGLSICSRLVQLMGGEFSVRSEPGRGSSFCFSAVFGLGGSALGGESPGRGGAGAAGFGRHGGLRPAQNRLRGARVLLADDHPVNQEIVGELLERAGACVTIAGNGLEAVEAVQQALFPFDLVLMDIQMPVLDGIQATGRIRELCPRETLPIIAMTANALSSERERFLSAGMNDHIAKPIDLKELFLVLTRWLGPLPAAGAGVALPAGSAPGGLPGDKRVPDRLPGLDVAAALKRLGGNTPLLVRLLAAFRDQHGSAVAEIREALAGGDPTRGPALLHKLAGVAANLGAEGVRAALAQLEGAVRDGSAERVEPLLNALQHQLQLLSEAARTLEGAKPPRKGGGTGSPSVELAPLFSELSGLLGCNNLQAVQLFERLYPLLEPSPELEKLKRELDRLDFKSALATLQAVAGLHLPPSP